MLLAAVALGFLAENVREHFVERHRERDYLRKIAQDLRDDIENMDKSAPLEQARIAAGSRLLELYNSGEYKRRTAEFYLQGRIFMVRSSFVHTNAGFLQVIHSGGMRLITDPRILDAIQKYESAVEKHRGTQDFNDIQMTDVRRFGTEVFDVRVISTMLVPDRKPLDLSTYYRTPEGNPALLTDDEKIINRMMVGVFSAVNIESIRQSRLKDLRESATALIAMIETRRRDFLAGLRLGELLRRQTRLGEFPHL